VILNQVKRSSHFVKIIVAGPHRLPKLPESTQRKQAIPNKGSLGSVAGPVIQATGRSEFEDGLGSGDFVSGYSYHMSVRTRSDHTNQTKFQSQRPNDVLSL
jgi:hypothetical protein